MKKGYGVAAALLFFYLLAFPVQSLASAREGLLLWYRSIVPVLFPFFILCLLSIRLRLLDPVLSLLHRPFLLLFGCSRYGTFAVLTGFLCGFPMGAKVTADLTEQGLISREEARFLYGFVNNVSPAFLLSFLACDQFGRPDLRGTFLFLILGIPFLYGMFSSRLIQKGRKNSRKKTDPSKISAGEKDKKKEGESFSLQLLDDCIMDAAQNTVRLGGYILLFSILTGAAIQFLPIHHPAILTLAASLEVTNGIGLICQAPLSQEGKFILLNTTCAFGGCSALVQSAGVAKMDRSLTIHYIKSRAVTTLLSFLFSVAAVLLRFVLF